MENYVTYEQAQELRNIGFNHKCICCYDENIFEITPVCSDYNSPNYRWNLISAPSLYEAQKWLREFKDIHIEIRYTINPHYEPWIGKVIRLDNDDFVLTDTCDTYEEALSEYIDKAIEIIKKKEKIKSWKIS